ncbi:MAG: bifunctional pyr operon transcriptional regulator/uracil phosphoribosyltransferase PyrR [Desulfovermiculus sp.]|nr:bifunctional pyr operon transcriptional regulator/uracil phosphoribosyltransferase PyrR [Desulfovermiculus sp.]
MYTPIEILDRTQIGLCLERLASEILERHAQSPHLALVGIQRRGVHLAARLKDVLDHRLGMDVPLGKLDINLYRDDWTTLRSQPAINSTEIFCPMEDKEIILIDDVLFTGRTIRAALEAILDFGRPRRVELLVLIDRGHRELPIHADYIGKKVNTALEEQVDVLVTEQDGEDKAVLQMKERSQ